MSLDFYIAASVIFAIIVVGFIVSNVIILIDKQKNKDYLTQYWSELRDKDHDS
jgi:mannitol-specific phosphotransferase system IIBC component